MSEAHHLSAQEGETEATVATASSNEIMQNVAYVRIPASTEEDLIVKGFPLISAPRRDAYARTAAQTTEVLVADLGNKVTIMLSSLMFDSAAGPTDIAYYGYQVSRNLPVLRLIEEGRLNPYPTASLLRHAIAGIIEGYPAVREAHREAWVKTNFAHPPAFSGDDEYYRKYYRYENPLHELTREVRLVYSGFYVMANIGRADPTLLAQWIRLKRSRHGECKDMDVWLVDAYFRAAEPSFQRDRHFILIAGAQISGRTVRQSAWNAMWDFRDPLFRIRGVNPSGIRTVEIMEVPPVLPETMTDALKSAVLANFLEYADASAR